jgi:Ca-activated chloride channel homolog
MLTQHYLRLAQYCLILLCTFFLPTTVLPQVEPEQVHILPRKAPSALEAMRDASLTQGSTSFKAKADLVLVPVTVTDTMNRLILGLDKEHFEIYENKQPQTIKTFSSEDAPISVGAILDTSGSMESKIERAQEAVLEFVKMANPDDEFFVITFSDSPNERVDFETDPLGDISNKLAYLVPKGCTALLDAVYLGITKMRHAKYPRKALLIVSDGGDNHSYYTERELRNVVKEADVTIYAIGIYDHYFPTPEEELGPVLLDELSELTGGRSFVIDDPKDLVNTAAMIGVELRNIYVLSYHPEKTRHDGKWHKISVKLIPIKGLPPLQIHAKKGYYASAE